MSARLARPSRRSLLGVTGAAAATIPVAACDALSTGPQHDQGATGSQRKPADDAKEAPMLAALVSEGKLPPLEKRIPHDPLVMKPLERSGVHGGTIRRASTDHSVNDLAQIAPATLYEWDLKGVNPVPGLASKVRIEDEGRAFTFTLRKGLKWSDGHPFTADDLDFCYQHVLLNKDLTPVFPTHFTINGKPMRFTKHDQQTFTLSFEGGTYGLLLKVLAHIGMGQSLITPAHYLKKFHKDFLSKEELAAKNKRHQTKSWVDLFGNRNDSWTNTDRPTLGAWRLTRAWNSGGNERVEMERNPYYWKVDPGGKQLPYVDRLVYNFHEPSTLTLAASNGEVDFGAHGLPFDDLPIVISNGDKHNYSVYRWRPDSSILPLYINQNHKDDAVRQVFQNQDFRIGVSHALNRDQINKALYLGEGRLQQPPSMPQDEYWKDGFGEKYLKHDAAEANKRLDAAGLHRRDDDGMRLLPDGRKLSISIMTWKQRNNIDGYELVCQQLAKVGLRLKVKTVSRDLFYHKAPQGDYDIAGFPNAPGVHWDTAAIIVVPTASLCYWAWAFGKWYETDGESGVKPHGIYRKMQEWYDELRSTVDHKRQLELGRKILEAHYENLWVIGIVQQPFSPLVVSDDLVNVRKVAVATWPEGIDEATKVEQIFYKDPAQHQH